MINRVDQSVWPPAPLGVENTVEKRPFMAWILFGKCAQTGVEAGLVLSTLASLPGFPFTLLFAWPIGIGCGIVCGAVHGAVIVPITGQIIKHEVTSRRYISLICAHSILVAMLITAILMSLGSDFDSALVTSLVYGVIAAIASLRVALWFSKTFKEYFLQPDYLFEIEW